MTTTATPVDNTLGDAWKVLNSAKETITKLTLKDLAEAVREVVPDAVTMTLEYVESADWHIIDAAGNETSAYDIAEEAERTGALGVSEKAAELEDTFSDLTPYFWAYEPYALADYATTLDVERHTGELGVAKLSIEVCLGERELTEEERRGQ